MCGEFIMTNLQENNELANPSKQGQAFIEFLKDLGLSYDEIDEVLQLVEEERP
jgi:hypothetical protein